MNSITPERRSHLLLVENNPQYVRLVQVAFREINPTVDLHVAYDGAEAMAFLRHDPVPDLILLDLNLPEVDGREVLTCIKEDDGLKTIPTIILTSSEAQEDVIRCYKLRANCYLRKPLKWDDLEKLMVSLNSFWLTACKLPAGRPTNRLRVMES